MHKIPFNKPYLCGEEIKYILKAHSYGQLAGDGPFTKKCNSLLENITSSPKVLLTHSCTAALEMSAILADIKQGDEIIMPSFTFVSTANAFVLRGGVPVFVDIREDTQNINEQLIEEAITNKTKAIVVVHYAGVACEMETIIRVARKYNLMLIEDAAQAILSTYNKIPLGSFGSFGTISFHETKNIICGEGGALLINSSEYNDRSEIIREKGTDRVNYFEGKIDKYTWQDIGSSFLPGELSAAFLYSQLEKAHLITEERLKIWGNYHKHLKILEDNGLLKRPLIPSNCAHNGHMYYIILDKGINREELLKSLLSNGIHAVTHYTPLHNSKGGKRFGRHNGDLKCTLNTSNQIIRLPLWNGLNELQVEFIVSCVEKNLLNYKKM